MGGVERHGDLSAAIGHGNRAARDAAVPVRQFYRNMSVGLCTYTHRFTWVYCGHLEWMMPLLSIVLGDEEIVSIMAGVACIVNVLVVSLYSKHSCGIGKKIKQFLCTVC